MWDVFNFDAIFCIKVLHILSMSRVKLKKKHSFLHRDAQAAQTVFCFPPNPEKSTNFASKYHNTIVCCLYLIIHSKIQSKKALLKDTILKSHIVYCVYFPPFQLPNYGAVLMLHCA